LSDREGMFCVRLLGELALQAGVDRGDASAAAGAVPATRAAQPRCRHIADETPHHGPTRPSTIEHRPFPEPWTVQHLRVRLTTARHAFGGFPKPGVAGSSPAGGAKTPAYGTEASPRPPKSCPNRQECRHFADETWRHGGTRKSTGQHSAREPAASVSMARHPIATLLRDSSSVRSRDPGPRMSA
jgi:hypothetical protein